MSVGCIVKTNSVSFRYWDGYEISCGFVIILETTTVDINIKEVKDVRHVFYKPYFNLFLYPIHRLFKTKMYKEYEDDYKIALEKYNKCQIEYQDFVNNSDKTLDKYYKEVYNVRQELISILENKKLDAKGI